MYIYIYIYLAIIAHEVLHVDFLRSFARKRGAKRRERLILERGSELLPVKVVDARVAAAEVEPRVARPRRASSRGHLCGKHYVYIYVYITTYLSISIYLSIYLSLSLSLSLYIYIYI